MTLHRDETRRRVVDEVGSVQVSATAAGGRTALTVVVSIPFRGLERGIGGNAQDNRTTEVVQRVGGGCGMDYERQLVVGNRSDSHYLDVRDASGSSQVIMIGT